MTSALALPGVMATVSAGDPLPGSTGAGVPVSEQAYWREPNFLAMPGSLQMLLSMMPGPPGITGALPRST
jgi:hypothetical protein